MKKLLSILLVFGSISVYASNFESGQFVGITQDAEQEICSINLNLSSTGKYVLSEDGKSNEYYLVKAASPVAGVDCPSEGSRYVGFQEDGSSEKELEICVDQNKEMTEVRYTHINADNILVFEMTCVGLKMQK